MKKNLHKILMLTIAFFMVQFVNAQYKKVSIRDIQKVEASLLADCRDSSSYIGDTVIVVGKVIMDGNLCEIVSSSVQGGFRPGTHLLDTAGGDYMGDFRGIQIMGTYFSGSASLPITQVYDLTAGDIIELTGIVGRFAGETQLTPLDNSSIKVLNISSAPVAKTIDLGLLNDNTRTNILTTGEEYEGSFVELKNVTVTAVNYFTGNTRVSIDVKDAKGNQINVSDRFMAQKLKTYNTTRSTAPYSTGRFVPPSVGTFYESLKGIILHSANGCLGGNGRGYELNPFDSSHYKIGDTPPNFILVDRTPLIPNPGDTAKISATVIDGNGTITSVKLYYSLNIADQQKAFTAITMQLKPGTTDEYIAQIPPAADNTLIRYYFEATDNDNNVTIHPSGVPEPNYLFYTVRSNGLSIVDIQKVLNPLASDVSPFLGKTVTVTGIVVASAKIYDLGYIYIQDADATEYAGIHCTGNSDLVKLFRTEEVTVTGIVEESFGFTQLKVTKVEKTGKTKNIQPITINPSDSVLFSSRAAEKYESMLVQFVNPLGGKIYISNPKPNNFADYRIATKTNATLAGSTPTQAGRQTSSNFSSLYVSVVADSTWLTTGGQMEVPVVLTQKGQSMDTLIGVLNFGFSEFKLLPRNNDDFRGFSETLEKAKYPSIPIGKLTQLNKNVSLVVYPNPSSDIVNIQLLGYAGIWNAQLMDLSGKTIAVVSSKNDSFISLNNLSSGLYTLRIQGEKGEFIAVTKIQKK